MIRSKLILLRLTGVLLFLAASPFGANAQWINQTNILVNGWNSVYLNVDASHDTIDNLVWKDNASPIQDIWMWNPTTGTAQYLTDPSSPLSARSQWQQWARSNVNIVTNQLTRLLANKAFLVRSTNAGNYSWVIKGRPAPPNYQWTTSGENFIGFPVDPTRSITFNKYLSDAPLFANTAQIFRYVGGALSATNPQAVQDATLVNIQRGQAYWVRSPDFNNYYAPFTVSGAGSGIAFGTTLGQTRITLANNTDQPLTVYLNLLQSEPPPNGQTVISAMPPVLIRGGLNITNLTYGYTALNGRPNFPILLEASGQPGASLDVIVGLNRSALTNWSQGELLAATLRITDSTQLAQIDLPVTASVADQYGLWVGSATVNAVDQYLNTYYTANTLLELTNTLRSLNILTNTVAKGTGLLGEYWTKGTDWYTSAPALTRVDSTINVAGTTVPPSDAISGTDYTVRWVGSVQTLKTSYQSEDYKFTINADDKIKLWINDLAIAEGTSSTAKDYSGSLTLLPGDFYTIKIEYAQGSGSATCKLYWESSVQVTNTAGVVSTVVVTPKQLIPAAQLYNSKDVFIGYRDGNTYQVDSASGRILELTSTSGAYLSTSTTVPNASVPVGFDLRLILHAGTNTAANISTLTLLQHVYLGSGLDGKQLITTTTNLLDRKKLGGARRISSTHFPWRGDNENTGWASRSNLLSPSAIGYGSPVYSTNVTGTSPALLTNLITSYTVTNYTLRPALAHNFNVELSYNDQASNPFVHAYHPDHDNLDADFLPIANGVESFKIIRSITLTPLAPVDTFQTLTIASGKLQGNYREQIKITDDGRKTRTFLVQGQFALNRISETPILFNANQISIPNNIGAYSVVGTNATDKVLGSITNFAAPVLASTEIILKDLTQVYDRTPKSAKFTTLPVGLTVALTYNELTTIPINAGTYAVRGTVVDRIFSGFTNGYFVITKAPVVITWANLSQTFSTTRLAVTATTSSSVKDLTLTYTGTSGTSYASSTSAPIDAGQYTVVATAPESANYQATLASETFVINKSPQAITWTNVPDRVYSPTDDTVTLTATANSDLGVTYTVISGPATIKGSKLTVTGAGTVVIAGNQAGSSNYLAAAEKTRSLVVRQSSQTITWANLRTRTYSPTDDTVTLAATSSSGLPVTYTVTSGPATVSGSTLTVIRTGTVLITARQAGDVNYFAASSVLKSFDVDKATQVISWADLGTRVYSTTANTVNLDATASSGLAITYSVTSGPATVSGTTLTVTGAGTVRLAAIQSGNFNYLAATTVEKSFVVTKGLQTITFPDLVTRQYSVSANTVTLAATSSAGLAVAYSVTSGPATVSGSTLTVTGVGTVVIAANQAGDGTYLAAPAVSKSLIVTQGSQTITWADLATRQYSVSANTVNLDAVSSSGLGVTYSVTSGPATVSGSTLTVTGVGNVVLVANQAGNATYLAATAVTKTLVITQGSQTITFPDLATRQYSVSANTVTLAATSSAGLTVTYSVTSGPATVSGTTLTVTGGGTVVIAANQAGNATYLAAPAVSKSLVITQAAQTITWADLATRQYSDSANTVTLAATSSSGLAVTYSVTSGPAIVSGSTLTVTGGGTVVIAANQAGDATYLAATAVTKTLVITQGSQTITFPDLVTRQYSVSANTVTLAATSSSGLGVTYSVTSGPATVSGSTLTVTGVGNVVLAANQAGNANYLAATAVTKTLVITQGSQTITWADLATRQYSTSANTVTLAATSSAGLTVTYSVTSGPATVSGSTLTVTGGGTVVIAANQAGNATYLAATAVSKSLVITPAAQTITWADLATRQFSTSANTVTLAATSSSGLAVTYSVTSGPATVSGSTLTVTGAGTVVIAANQVGNANYLAAAVVRKSLVVSKGTATVTIGNLTQNYNGQRKTVSWTTVPAGLTAFATYDGSLTAPTGALFQTKRFDVVVTVNDPNWQGQATGTLTIRP